MKKTSTFLSAEWKNLIMVNYVVDKEVLEPYLPYKTELDLWNGKCYLSLVGFMFQNTRVKGIKLPFHINFEEINMRFYVRYKENDIWKRGVVFIQEIVPKPAITIIANTLFKEHYKTLPTAHSEVQNEDKLKVIYRWKNKGKWNHLSIEAQNNAIPIAVDSEEEFITEHYWGYTRINEKLTSEYGVEHPRWFFYPTLNFDIAVDFEANYGKDFSFLQNQAPVSVFMAKGSEIKVRSGKKIVHLENAHKAIATIMI